MTLLGISASRNHPRPAYPCQMLMDTFYIPYTFHLADARIAQQQQQQQHDPQGGHHQRFLTAPHVVSFDSGLPLSHGGSSDDDRRLSLDSQILAASAAPRQRQQQHSNRVDAPIGYEPAFMVSYEPASSQDEPIYRPSFLGTGANGQSPVKFRYHHHDGANGKQHFGSGGKLPRGGMNDFGAEYSDSCFRPN